jgi:bifunctional non-homologous end joining protein LigD
LTATYPSAVSQIRRLPCKDAILDGEIVVVDNQGRPSFQALQNYSGKGGQSLLFIAFDLLNYEGRSLLSLPLTDRQEALAKLAKAAELQVSESLDSEAGAVIEGVRALGLEGVVAKRKDSKYQPGIRGRSWFKYRIGLAQAFVVGGYTLGDPFNSLLVGYYEGRKLVYAGKVKAGYTGHSRRALFAELDGLQSEKCPFVNLPESKGGRWGEGLAREEMAKCVWVKPKLVAQVSFVEWTGNEHLRHATFIDLRTDVRATTVIREKT